MNTQKVGIIISDLRLKLLLCAIDLHQKFDNSELIISTEVIQNIEFGSASPKWYKKIKVFIISRLYNVKIIPTNCINNRNGTGVSSSLISWTTNHAATREKYENFALEFARQEAGAKSVWEYIKANNFESIYIFNGRFSSSEPIAKLASESKINVWFYEYGNIPHHYTLSKDRIHDVGARALKSVKILESNEEHSLAINIDKLANEYINTKLKNKFTKTYIKSPDKYFDIAIFLSSSHEISAMDSSFYFESDEEYIQKIVKTISKEKRIAIRVHPNMAKDPELNNYMDRIKELSCEHDVEIFEPLSGLNSYELMKNSEIVATNLSTIAVDAYLLGLKVSINYPFNFKIFIDYCDSLPIDTIHRKLTLAKLCVISQHVNQVPMSPRSIVIYSMLRKIDYFFITDSLLDHR